MIFSIDDYLDVEIIMNPDQQVTLNLETWK